MARFIFMGFFTDAFYSLSSKTNKVDVRDEELQDGLVSDFLPELDFPISDEKLIELTDKWKLTWETSPVYAEFVRRGQEN